MTLPLRSVSGSILSRRIASFCFIVSLVGTFYFTLLYTAETYCRLSLFLIAVACKDFPTATSLAAYSCSPRAETVISSLRSLSAYHRLAFPGLYSSILSVFSVANILMSVFTGADSTLQFIAVPSTKEALLARN